MICRRQNLRMVQRCYYNYVVHIIDPAAVLYGLDVVQGIASTATEPLRPRRNRGQAAPHSRYVCRIKSRGETAVVTYGPPECLTKVVEAIECLTSQLIRNLARNSTDVSVRSPEPAVPRRRSIYSACSDTG